MHKESHPQAGQTVRIKDGTIDPAQQLVVGGAEYRIEDWWDKLTGRSWAEPQTPAEVQYIVRSAYNNLPLDEEVVYGKIGNLGHLVHVSEIE